MPDTRLEPDEPVVAFIKARHAEEENLALATTPVPVEGRWCVTRDKHAADDAPFRLVQGYNPHDIEDGLFTGNYNHGLPVIAMSAAWEEEHEANLQHIAYWDPERVLAGIAAERTVLHVYETYRKARDIAPPGARAAADLVVRTLRGLVIEIACARADHPDYKPGWRFDA